MSENQAEMKRGKFFTVFSVVRLFVLPALGILILQCLSAYQQRFDESVYFNGNWATSLGARFVFNYLILLIFYVFLYFLPFFKVTSCVMNLVVFLFALAEHYVILFRNTIIYPWDLDSIGLAANVSGTYDFSPTREVYLAIFFLLVMIALSVIGKEPKFPVWIRISGMIAVVLAGAFYSQSFVLNRENQIKNGVTFYYTLVNYNYDNGVLLNFCYHFRFLVHTEPAGYNKATVENELSALDVSTDSIVPGKVKPDVIMIMSEAFSDLRDISYFPTNIPAMPFWDSLDDDPNCIKKTLISSSFGGNTANSEFEVLTGMSIRSFSPGTYPYKHYIRSDVSSIASILGDNGYQIYSVHPFDITGWNREAVMPLLGFPVFDGEDVFTNPTRYRTYISDQTAYSYIIDHYEQMKEKNPNDPIFEYLISIQNHGGYASKETLPYDVYPDLGKDYPQAEQYLSLLRMSDDALQNLIQYFSQVDRPTVIILYGDHQPNLSDGFQDDLRALSNEEEDPYAPLSRYKTQLMIWANYDLSGSNLAKSDVDMISNNYVLPSLTDIIGIQKTPFLAFTSDMQKTIPVMNDNYLITADGSFFNARNDELPAAVKDELQKYEYYQYYVLYDEQEKR